MHCYGGDRTEDVKWRMESDSRKTRVRSNLAQNYFETFPPWAATNQSYFETFPPWAATYQSYFETFPPWAAIYQSYFSYNVQI